MGYRHWHSSGSYEPLAYVRGFPIDLTTLITALHILTTVICAVALSLGQKSLWELNLIFTTTGFWDGKVWTVFTDPFYHNIAQEHIFLALNLFFFLHFGREIERMIGRWNFGLLYLALLILPAMACILGSAILGTPLGVRVPYVLTTAHFAILIGFTYIYPTTQFIFGITARWVGIILIGVTTLALIAIPYFGALIPFAASLLTVYAFLNFVGAAGGINWVDTIQNWREKKQDQLVQERRVVQKNKRLEQEASVDTILDKISQHGIQSLTAKERAFLEKEGSQLKAKEEQQRR
ncbi:MAG: DUF6576 domain-containing protein [Blastochloris sp.]|nr:DUF6576 domain-containing protein [Blastochloris sp.]